MVYVIYKNKQSDTRVQIILHVTIIHPKNSPRAAIIAIYNHKPSITRIDAMFGSRDGGGGHTINTKKIVLYDKIKSKLTLI